MTVQTEGTIFITTFNSYCQWRIQVGCGRIPLSSDKNFLNDYILGMYDCKCLTTPGCRQCTPLDVNNKSIFHK